MLNGPEARHGTVINAVRRAGHALRHSCLHELVVKCPVGKVEDGAQIEFMYHYTVKSLKFRHLSETLFAQESVDKIRLRTLRAEDFRAGFMKSKCLGQIEI